MRLKRLTLLRPGMGNFRSTDGLPPLSLAILAARTPQSVQIKFFDEKVETIPENDQPDMVAITVETFTARRAYEIAKSYRERGTTVVMGGYHPTFLPNEALLHADAIVIGDAEGSWENLIDDFNQNELKQRYSGGNKFSLNNMKMDRSIFKGKKYPPVELVQYTRGCRFSCDFCSIRAFYQSEIRSRKASEIAEEIKTLNKNKLMFFVDDNLFSSRELLSELLEKITPLGIRWTCQISIDVARDEQLLDQMAKAGCILALIGFESLSKENLKQMNKPWNKISGDYLEVVKKFHKRGIAIYGTFVFGYDYDTTDTIRRSLEFAKNANIEIANFNPLTPTPNSPLYDRLKKEGRLLSPKWWLDKDYHYGDPIFIPKLISSEDFTKLCFTTKKSFYSWTSIIKRLLQTDAGIHWFRTSMIARANIISRREILRKQSKRLGST